MTADFRYSGRFSDLKKSFLSFAYWLGTLLLWELSLHFTAFTGIVRFLPGLCFTVAYAAVLTLLTGLPKWVGRVCGWVLPPLVMLVYGVQLIYYEVFGSFLSLAFVSAGGDALTTFYMVVLSAMWRRLPQLLLLIMPVVGYHVLRRFDLLSKDGHPWRFLLGLFASAALFLGSTVMLLPAFGQGANAPAAMFRNPATTIDRWAEHFGFLTAEVLDLSRQGSTSAAPVLHVVEPEILPDADDVERNALPGLDFAALNEKTDDPALQNLNTYLSTVPATEKHDYTGIFEGYNLIVVCAEAFSNYVIDPELTPTLYRMSQEGIVFENFYNSFPNLTTNGEYSLCMGLMPDLSRMSFAVSMENYVPYALGNICTENGMTAMAYHNNVGTFYNRINTHSNMGYGFKAVDFGLDMAAGSPSSDLEMLEKTVDDYLTKEPFHAYYMTYSGHSDYDFETNEMCIKNQSLVEHLDSSEPVRAYIACQLELEAAMTYLIGRLEEAGIADRTVIVLTGDHLPYGLSEKAYAELAGERTADPFWQYRNSFICWTGGLEEPIVVEDYCCTMDILPTILNLMGFPYDSRLLTGRDVLADTTHMALLKDGSFLTADMVYDANSGLVTWTGEEDTALADSLIQYAANQFTVSAAILGTDYYDFVFSSLDLTVERVEHETYDSYADIAGTWYKDAVELLTTYGALSGGKTGAFNGEVAATRADFVAMVTRSLGLVGSADLVPFSDVDRGTWYYDTLAAAVEAGLIVTARNFRPREAITVKEAKIILNRAKKGPWVDVVVAEALENQVAAGYTGEPDTISRGAAAYIVSKLLDPASVEIPEPEEEPVVEEEPVYIPQPQPEPEPFQPPPDPLAP